MPAAVIAGLQAQGLQVQGLQVQGLQVQGLQVQGLQVQGLQVQGLQVQGAQLQGLQVQGLQVQGLQVQGLQVRRRPRRGWRCWAAISWPPISQGVEIGSVEMRGTTATSALQAFDMVAGPGNTSAPGGYILVAGGSAVGHYAIAHLVDVAGNPAEDLDLYIGDERPDPVPNLLHRGDDQINDDVTLYTVFFFHKWSGQWASLCPFHAATGGATAMAIVEDPAQPSRFVFACTANGVASKCARGWGFRPWRDDHSFVFDDASGQWVEQTYPMKPFYDACKIAARAAYCQDRQSFTREGTLVDLFDTRQFVWPNAIENPFGDDPDSRWMFAQEFFVSVDPLASHPELKASALQRTRYRDLSPVGQCADLAFVDRLEQDHFEDGRWASPLTGTPRIEVFSPNYCVHNEQEIGAGLPWDCSPCTTAVCKNQPRCCRARRRRAGLGRAVRRRGAGDLRRSAGPCLAARRDADGAAAGQGPARARAARSSASTGPARGGGGAVDAVGVGLRSRVAGRGGDASRSTAVRRASSPAANCWVRPTPISRWRCRSRARSAPPATVRSAMPPATGSASRCRRTFRATCSSTRSTPRPPTGRRRPRRCCATESSTPPARLEPAARSRRSPPAGSKRRRRGPSRSRRRRSRAVSTSTARSWSTGGAALDRPRAASI